MRVSIVVVLEVGIISAQGLMPMKTRDGRGTTDAYCVSKYGQKWIRTRTIVDNLSEDSRVYAGLKIHPFFSLWKVEKKNQEEECSLIPTKREGRGVTCDSIHVFENVQDDVSPLDWSGWTFLNDTTTAEFGPTSLNLCFVESLNFDNFPDALKSSSTSISQNVMSCSDQLFKQSDNMLEISLTNSAGLANERAICPSKLEGVKDLDLEGNEINTFSGHKNIFRKSDTEPQSKFLQERLTHITQTKYLLGDNMRKFYHSESFFLFYVYVMHIFFIL
ncbi:uncharacterized protein LOC109796452 isoform X1 [Cajanus cajan]|uniref:uncharacterized protein LOC109796452 isoform X1 n=2 Tax=Cajanus cajan TaxID=3821 RepID=UPI0010FB9FC5|nr:uncharacterized protein LOC109796452 isoform X1 [Cajanus cajan]